MKNNKLNINQNQNNMKVTKGFLIDYDNEDKWKEGLKEIQSDYSKIVEMTEKAYNFFLNGMPPLRFNSVSFLTSEPYTHNNEGEAVYLAAIKTKNKYFAQMSTRNDYDNRKLFK